MNYQKIHDDLVEHCKNQVLPKTVYTEKHHIIPRSLGGSDTPDNLVKVTARQHFILHALLFFIAKRSGDTEASQKMAHAWNLMRSNPTANKARYINSRLFEAAREDISKRMSVLQSGKKNSQYNTMWITNGYKNKKHPKDQEIPEGFWKGRYSNGRKYDPEVPYGHERSTCVECNSSFFRKTNKSMKQRKTKCDDCVDMSKMPLVVRERKELIELIDSGMSAHQACKTIGKKHNTNMANYGLSGAVVNQVKLALEKENRFDLLGKIK